MSLIPNYLSRRPNAFDPLSRDVFDPFEGFPFNPNDHLRSLSDRLRSNFPSSSDTASFVHMSIDWKETPTAHVFKADVPGLNKEDMTVGVVDNKVLQISGERRKELEDEGDTWHRVERGSGKFLRRFWLPENAKVEETKSDLKNGVLTVTIPKEQVKKPDVKSIEISG